MYLKRAGFPWQVLYAGFAPDCQEKFSRKSRKIFRRSKEHSPDKRKDYQTFPACRELVTLDKCRISKHEKLSSYIFRKNKKYLSNNNRYLQTVSLQVPEKIEKNKLRKEDKK